MSTRSYIGIENNDGSVSYVYCHWDGYPEGVGSDVVNLNRVQTSELIKKGDMSVVGKPYTERGELYEDVKPRTVASMDEYNEAVKRGSAECGYVITKAGEWVFFEHHAEVDNVCMSLRAVLTELKAAR